jgi:hypothetical protein
LDHIGNKSVNEYSNLTFTISATDPEDDSLTYTASDLPDGATFDPGTRAFSWTPTISQSGTYNVTFTVRDIYDNSDSEIIAITVNDFDATGTWTYSTTNNWVNPGNAECTAEQNESGSVAITQNGNSVTLVGDGKTYTGTVNGETYAVSASYPEEGGTVTENIYFTLSSGTSGSGSFTWSWSAGSWWCNGGGDFTIKK